MHFITFPVATTNIFPLSNSTKGGQLVTEYNLKSREMVATDPNVKYPIGPSFIHSLDDFKVKLLEDTEVPAYDQSSAYHVGDYCTYNGTTYVCISDTTAGAFDPNKWKTTSISNSVIQVDPGRAVINGHFVETLSPMIVDLNLANYELHQQNKEPLYGNLSIGLKTYFSTESTMSGSMLVENTDDMYIGVQIVIEKAANFTTPSDCPAESQEGIATADIKLADFTYLNGTVPPASIIQNSNATRYIPSERIADFDNVLDDRYITKSNLVDNYLYTFSGKSKWWCNSVDSLMVWDSHSEDHWGTEVPPSDLTEAAFVSDSNGNVKLAIPHKQPDAPLYNDNNQRLYYSPRIIDFPTASYTNDTSGIVTKEYTQKIKNLAAIINTYKQFTNGKQIMYLDTLTMDSHGELSYEFPTDLSNFNVGDYILVREDYSIGSVSESGAAPSTMYFVLPGGITSIKWEDTTKPSGIRLGDFADLYEDNGATPPTALSPTAEELLNLFNYNSYQGTSNDYFELRYHYTTNQGKIVTSYYYSVNATGPKLWSDAILLTGGIPLATENLIGGFYNASMDEAYADAGYVYLDSTGHLRLRDYALLRTGALAYQLGADFSVPNNQTVDYINAYLDESVNERVAFKTPAEVTTTPSVINVYIPLPTEEGVISIYDLDSRFGTGVYIHFTTDDKTADYSKLIINISDCEKIRIDNNITTWLKGPVINVFRSCLYYDPIIINYILECDVDNLVRPSNFPMYTDFTGFDGLTLWYARFEDSDPDIVINGMEIIQPNISSLVQEVSYWSETITGDNHYSYALRSVTLDNNGVLIGASIYVANSSTPESPQPLVANTTTRTVIADKFLLPQGSELNYPVASIKKAISITGTITSAYLNDAETDWIVTDTIVSAKSGVYQSDNGLGDGSIAFNSCSYLVQAIYTNFNNYDAWNVGEYHVLYGGTTV